MTGLHVVSKAIATGRRWYVYAWRGGPCIHTVEGAKPVIGPELLDKAAKARQDQTRAVPQSIAWLCGAYRASPEFDRLADSTQRDYRRWLDRIEERFGTAPLAAFEDRRMRAVIIDWRNTWAAKPRSADKATVMLATLLGWALEQGLLSINVAAKIAHLHSADRAEIIWTEADWTALAGTKKNAAGKLVPIASKQLLQALRLASLTGLRLGDLISLTWDEVGARSIVKVTSKKKRRVVIPILPELGKLLADLGEREGTVLKNTRGEAWTDSGLETMFQRAKADAKITVRIHDLRGTYATWLAVKGLTDEEIGRIVGWSPRAIAEVRHRYIDEAHVVVSLIQRLSEAG